jgi:hypothetical protein
VGLFGNVNDSQVLKKSKLYQRAIHGGLFDMAIGLQDGIFYMYLGINITRHFLGSRLRINKINSNIQCWNYSTTTNTKGGGQLLKMPLELINKISKNFSKRHN